MKMVFAWSLKPSGLAATRRVEIDSVVERPTGPCDLDKTRRRKVSEVMRQGVLFQTQSLGDLGRPHALRRKAHQQAEDRHPAGVAERGESVDGATLFHISRLTEIKNCVQ